MNVTFPLGRYIVVSLKSNSYTYTEKWHVKPSKPSYWVQLVNEQLIQYFNHTSYRFINQSKQMSCRFSQKYTYHTRLDKMYSYSSWKAKRKICYRWLSLCKPNSFLVQYTTPCDHKALPFLFTLVRAGRVTTRYNNRLQVATSQTVTILESDHPGSILTDKNH